MWSSNNDKDTERSQNIPIYFKNFNPYDILEPKKVNHEKNEDVSTAVLIEIDDNANKCNNSVESTLHGSFLDRVKKSEYDLLDLYQNIYVTPQEIKKKDDLRNQNSSLNNIIKDSNIDFTELFEKAEHGQKLTEWQEFDIKVNNVVKDISVPNLSNLSKTNPTDFNQTHLDTSISRKEIPHPHTYKINLRCSNNTGEGVPQPSSIEKSTASNNGILDSAISLKCAQLNLESDSDSKFTEPEPICEDEIDEFLKPKLQDPSSLIKKSAPLASGKPYNDFSASLSNHNGNHLSHTIENSTSLIIEPKLHVTPIHPTYTKSSLTDLNSPSLYRLACQQESIPVLHTVKLQKAFKNRRIVKKDCEIVGFTKGPDIFEKSIVLPKIMERLAERKRMFDERKSMQRKLMLVTGEKLSFDEVNINNAVEQTSKSFEPYLITNTLLKQNGPGKLAYQTAKEICKQDKPTKLVAKETVNGFNNKEPSKLSYQMTGGFVNEPTKETASHKVVSLCNTNETNKLVACQKVDALGKPKLSLKTPDYYLEPDKSAKLEPKVLMEDCNTKRVIALKTRVALEKFVKTGKLPP